MTQQRLFIGEPEVLQLSATYVAPRGWSLRVAVRRQGQAWADAQTRQYSNLTSAELADVIAIEALESLQMR